MPFNLPNILTWMRISGHPAIRRYFLFSTRAGCPLRSEPDRHHYFTGAAITDWLDGYLARVLRQTSAFGAFLDPVADKLMVAAALIVLVYLSRLDALIAFIIIGREITISALREWMAQIGKGKSMAVSFLGKLKTISQMAAIPLLLYHDKIGENFDPQEIGTWLIYLAAILTLWSMAYYLKVAIPRR